MSQVESGCPGSCPFEEMLSLYTDLALRPDTDFKWARGKGNARTLGFDEIWVERCLKQFGDPRLRSATRSPSAQWSSVKR